MAHGIQDGDDIISGINVTPLVDIVLVILIIFIVTASFVLRPNIPMELPSAQTAEAGGLEGLLNLGITAEGALFINGQPATLEQIPQAVEAQRAKLAGTGRKISAFVSADIKARYGTFAQVVDMLRLQGVSEIALDTQPAEVRE